jgi:hypothetical protein
MLEMNENQKLVLVSQMENIDLAYLNKEGKCVNSMRMGYETAFRGCSFLSDKYGLSDKKEEVSAGCIFCNGKVDSADLQSCNVVLSEIDLAHLQDRRSAIVAVDGKSALVEGAWFAPGALAEGAGVLMPLECRRRRVSYPQVGVEAILGPNESKMAHIEKLLTRAEFIEQSEYELGDFLDELYFPERCSRTYDDWEDELWRRWSEKAVYTQMDFARRYRLDKEDLGGNTNSTRRCTFEEWCMVYQAVHLGRCFELEENWTIWRGRRVWMMIPSAADSYSEITYMNRVVKAVARVGNLIQSGSHVCQFTGYDIPHFRPKTEFEERAFVSDRFRLPQREFCLGSGYECRSTALLALIQDRMSDMSEEPEYAVEVGYEVENVLGDGYKPDSDHTCSTRDEDSSADEDEYSIRPDGEYERFFGRRGMYLAGTDHPMLVHDTRFGAKVRPSVISSADALVQAVFRCMSFGELFPTFYYADKGLYTAYESYWENLMTHIRRFRVKNVQKRFWNYLRSESLTVKLLISQPVVGRDRHWALDACIRYSLSLEVAQVQGPENVSIFSAIGDGLSSYVTPRRRRSGNYSYGPDLPKRVILADLEESVGMLKHAGLAIVRKGIIIDAIAKFFRERDWLRGIGQMVLLATENDSFMQLAYTIYDGWRLRNKAKEWLNGQTFDVSDLEIEPDTVEVCLNGDNVLFSHSILWKKFLALLTAMSLPAPLALFPSVVANLVQNFSTFTFRFSELETLQSALFGFVKTLMDRTAAFLVSWDWREFLADGGFDSFIVRGYELMSMSTKNAGQFGAATLYDVVEKMNVFLKEGDGYRLADSHRYTKRFLQTHEAVYKGVLTLRNKYQNTIDSASKRAKEPYPVILHGPPGIGKTAIFEEMTLFAVEQDPERRNEDGSVTHLGSDMYPVPVYEKHWNLCSDPKVVVFPDIRGDGYTNNGTTMNMPDTLRLAVDIQPFFTPQADIADKLNNVIDPDVVGVTSNAMRWCFSVYGTDWKKLIRRYPNIYYLAYPSKCYSVDISESGSDHGTLINEKMHVTEELAAGMRVYHCVMMEEAGNITFKRTKLIGIGREVLMITMKKGYMAHMAKTSYSIERRVTCNMRTTLAWHIGRGPCMNGCNYMAEEEEKVEEVQGCGASKCATPAGVVTKATASLADAHIERVVASQRKKMTKAFERIKPIMVALSVALAAAGAAMLVGRQMLKESVAKVEGVINPIQHDLPAEIVVRYGVSEAVAREQPNPPKFPANLRSHVFSSPASRTSTFDDVLRLVRSNTVEITNGKGAIGYMVFVNSNTAFMAHHVWKMFNGGMVKRVMEGNDFKIFPDLSNAVHDLNRDYTLVRTHTTPFADITKHLADSVGDQINVVFKNEEKVVARLRNVAFNGKLGLNRFTVLAYPKAGVEGDCGSFVVGDLDGKGLVVGSHIARLTDGEGAAIPMDRNVIMKLLKELGGSGPDVVIQPFADKVEVLHARSRFRSAASVSMGVLGTFESAPKPSRSRLVKTELHDMAMAEMKEKKVIPPLQLDGALVDGVWMAPYVHKFAGMAFEPSNVKVSELKRAMEDYLAGAPLAKLAPLTLHQAIAGVEGDPMLKSMNLATSAGVFQRFYPNKRSLIDHGEINADFHKTFLKYLRLLEDHIVAEHQKWALKDEAVTEAKAAKMKFRYFMVSDLFGLIAFRMFLAPLVAHFYRHKAFFECFGAFNPASPEFGAEVERMRKFIFLLMADMKHMDSSHRAFMADVVAEVFCAVAKDAGYNEMALKIVRNLVKGIVFTQVEFNGDLSFFTEGMGSGVYITFIFNCIVLSILYRLAWFTVSSKAFREHNVLLCGGDDSACSTSEPKFTGFVLEKVFAEYGYEVSPPTDKTGKMSEFFPWEEFVFLKRSPRTVTYMGSVYEVGALDKDSIWKSLAFEMPKADVTHLDRMAQVLDAAQREMALHGREAFDDFIKKVTPFKLRFRSLTYDEIMYRYQVCAFYDDIIDAAVLDEVLEVVGPQDVYEFVANTTSPKGSFKDLAEVTQIQGAADHLESKMIWSIKEAAAPAKWNEAQAGSVFTDVSSINHNYLMEWRRSEISKYPSSIFIGNDRSLQDTSRTATFNLASQPLASQVPPHFPADYASAKEALTIQEALSRPVHLYTYSWTPLSATSTAVGECFDSWRADSFVLSKLTGYKFFRGKIKLRFVVNGFSFYYGKLVMSADLCPGSDGFENGFDPRINSVTVENVAQAMQVPHATIDPSQSATYDLSLPFYSTTGWFNRFNAPINPAIRLQAWVVNTLASANDIAPTSVTVQVYMMVEDIELSIPSVEAILGKKHGVAEEAAPSGTLSSKLSALSSATGAASHLPIIGSYLTPFSMLAGAAASVAGQLGYSKPPILEESRPTLNMSCGSASFMDGREAIDRLVADPKQGVSFTAEAATIGEDDDMMLSTIVRRAGLVDQFSWTTLGLTGTVPINPLHDFADSGGWVQFSPLGFVASTFKYWSGSITFRIELVASAFHRGAIGVSWIPYSDPPGGDPLTYPNKYMTHIMDVTQTKVTDFVVPFGGDKPNLRVVGDTLDEEANGHLIFYEINPLRSAGSTSSVGINVYMFAGDDFQLYRPTTEYISQYSPLSVDAIQGPIEAGEVDDSEAASEVSPIVESVEPDRTLIYFGEKITSIKQLASRYTPVKFQVTATSLNLSRVYQHPIYVPPPWGALDSWIYASYASWYAPAFLSMRGGTRFKYVPYTAVTTSTASATQTTQVDPRNYMYNVVLGDAIGTYTPSEEYYLGKGATFSSTGADAVGMEFIAGLGNGALIGSTWSHSALEYELPAVNAARFVNPRKILPWYYPSKNIECGQIFQTSKIDGTTSHQLWYAVADDFSLHHFMCVPRVRLTTAV